MSAVEQTIDIHPGFKGVVTGMTRAGNPQRALIIITDANEPGRIVRASTLIGSGEGVPMMQEVGGAQGFSWPPLDGTKKYKLSVKITSNSGNGFVDNKLSPAITSEKKSEPANNDKDHFFVSQFLSEDSRNLKTEQVDFDDCIITVLQYKKDNCRDKAGEVQHAHETIGMPIPSQPWSLRALWDLFISTLFPSYV
ncbi:hypothetical protein M422DRAFT_243184 [Sphaerobolus stellatus SS14]|nr:hypothetical protein M422DRAFT_243184 [Sphaerobolus stellatus SS14]